MMLKILRWIALVVTILSILGYLTYYSIVQLSDPSLTPTQVALLTWPALIPVAISGLILALVAYLEQRH